MKERNFFDIKLNFFLKNKDSIFEPILLKFLKENFIQIKFKNEISIGCGVFFSWIYNSLLYFYFDVYNFL
jgi:hypothetical protein